MSACVIFNAANVKLGVLFNSHHMFSPFPHLLHCELLCSLILRLLVGVSCLNVDSHNLGKITL